MILNSILTQLLRVPESGKKPAFYASIVLSLLEQTKDQELYKGFKELIEEIISLMMADIASIEEELQERVMEFTAFYISQ